MIAEVKRMFGVVGLSDINEKDKAKVLDLMRTAF